MAQVRSSCVKSAPKKPNTYRDNSARRAIRAEERKLAGDPNHKISGDELIGLVHRATSDKDAQAAGQEHKDLSKFVESNWDKMTPEAKAAWKVFDDVAAHQTAKGQTGIPNTLYQATLSRMKVVSDKVAANTDKLVCKPKYQDASSGAAVEGLKKQPHPISGEALEKAIIDGTKDLDSQAAGREYNDLSKYVKSNWNHLSPNAKAKWRVYEQTVQRCKCRGQSGIPMAEYNQMKKDMAAAGYQDASAGKAIEDLRAQGNPITGDKLQTAVENATKDLDAQAAGKEFADLNKYIKANWNQLTPQAKKKWAIYENKAKECQAKGQSGIPMGEYKDMLADMKAAGYRDTSAGNAIEGLKNGKKPISAEAMEDAIINGTKDWDGQAAGKEFADFRDFVKENWKDMTPGARAKYRVYAQTAQLCKMFGLSGIPGPLYGAMKGAMKEAGYHDKSAGQAIERLEQQPRPVSGAAMEQAIVDATKDLDNNAAGGEFKDLSNWARENWSEMSPEARAKFNVYKKYAKKHRAAGRTGIPVGDYCKMVQEMKGAKSEPLQPVETPKPQTPNYEDKTAGAAIEGLKTKPQPYSGKDVEKAIIDATKDLDSQAAGKEYRDLNKFVTQNWDKLSPDAKAKWRVYNQAAQKAQCQGKTGIPVGDYNKMVADMKKAGYQDASAGQAVESLHSANKPISGDDFQKAIIDGTKDLDAQAAGKEYADLKKFVDAHGDQLSPEAKAKWEVYEDCAKKFQAKGKTGIPVSDYNKMVADMKVAGYQDKSSGAAIEGLKAGPKPVSADAMEKAILDGTSDLDSQAAGKEYADLSKYVNENWESLSGGAKAKWRTYERYAESAQRRGHTGIPASEYAAMKSELKSCGYRDASSAVACELLDAQKGPIGSDALIGAVTWGTADLDGKAFGREYEDLAQWVDQNKSRLTPEALAAWNVYEGAAERARDQGQFGCSPREYGDMLGRMAFAAAPDCSRVALLSQFLRI